MIFDKILKLLVPMNGAFTIYKNIAMLLNKINSKEKGNLIWNHVSSSKWENKCFFKKFYFKNCNCKFGISQI